jgi:hypothetical protein
MLVMALINCFECDHQVSDKAASCPHCGVPLNKANRRVGTTIEINTVEETAKRFKLQKILSITLAVLGLVGGVFGDKDANGDFGLFWVFVSLVGCSWYVVNRMRIWWHHH